MTVPLLRNAAARRVFLDRHGLGLERPDNLVGVLDQLGFVQLDSVNTFARAHDMVLWARKPRFQSAHLDTLLARDRGVFEHWTHDAASVPMAFWPHWRLRFARDAVKLSAQWSEWRRDDFHAKTEAVLRQITDHGCCTSADVGAGEKRGKGGWWDWHPSKTALEYLWRTGALSVTRRTNFRKVYDLTERVIPQAVRATPFDEADSINWLCNGAVDRLGFATSGEIAAFWAHVTPAEAKAWCAVQVVEGALITLDVEAADGRVRRCFARPDLMDNVPDSLPGQVRILSPFDPALRDRKRAERLFGFHYRIEIFVPEAQRRYGYYVFPVLEGDRLIGRIDMKRKGTVLDVRAFWPEASVVMGAGRLVRLQTALGRAARFGRCDEVVFAENWLRLAG